MYRIIINDRPCTAAGVNPELLRLSPNVDCYDDLHKALDDLIDGAATVDDLTGRASLICFGGYAAYYAACLSHVSHDIVLDAASIVSRYA